MSLSPAALALKDDLYLLTRLPLSKEANLDAIKERVFGSESGVPRTEDESKRRYVDAIVQAFNASGAESPDEFAEFVENGARIAIDRRKLGDLADENKDLNRIVSQSDDAMQDLRERYDALDEKCASLRTERDDAIADRTRLKIALDAAQLDKVAIERDVARSEVRRLQTIIDEQGAEHEDVSADLRILQDQCDSLRVGRDEALATLDKARERIERLQEINEGLETRNREATQAGASFGVETCGLLAEKDAEISRLRIECDRAISDRDRAVTELEDMRERERIARADAVHCHQEMRTLRTDLAATRAAHAEITAAHAKLAAEVAYKDRLMRGFATTLTHAREEAKTAHAALTAEQGRSDRLRAVMVDLIADLNAAKEGGE